MLDKCDGKTDEMFLNSEMYMRDMIEQLFYIIFIKAEEMKKLIQIQNLVHEK